MKKLEPLTDEQISEYLSNPIPATGSENYSDFWRAVETVKLPHTTTGFFIVTVGNGALIEELSGKKLSELSVNDIIKLNV